MSLDNTSNGKNGHIKFLGKMNENIIPTVAIIFNAIISMIMVTLFRDWGKNIAVISTATLNIFNWPNDSDCIKKNGTNNDSSI